MLLMLGAILKMSTTLMNRANAPVPITVTAVVPEVITVSVIPHSILSLVQSTLLTTYPCFNFLPVLLLDQTRVTEWADRRSPVLVDRGIRTLVELNQWHTNWCVSLPSLALGIVRIGQGLVGSVLGQCDWVGYQVLVLVAWFPSGTTL